MKFLFIYLQFQTVSNRSSIKLSTLNVEIHRCCTSCLVREEHAVPIFIFSHIHRCYTVVETNTNCYTPNYVCKRGCICMLIQLHQLIFNGKCPAE